MKPERSRQEFVELLIESGSSDWTIWRRARRIGDDDPPPPGRPRGRRACCARCAAARRSRRARSSRAISAIASARRPTRKQRIARRAIDLSSPASRCFWTTPRPPGRWRRSCRSGGPLTVITNNLQAIGALAGAAGHSLIRAGRRPIRRSSTALRPGTEQALRGLRGDVAFLSNSASKAHPPTTRSGVGADQAADDRGREPALPAGRPGEVRPHGAATYISDLGRSTP